MMDIDISQYNIHIEDSFETPKRDIKGDLIVIVTYAEQLNCDVCNRSITSLALEWYAHNLLYKWHIKRERTKDVDLNYPQTWKERIFYPILGSFAWLIID